MDSVGAFEAKTHLSDLLDRVRQGEKITITRHGIPAAMLVPVEETGSRLTHREVVEGMRALRKRIKPDSMSVREMVNAMLAVPPALRDVLRLRPGTKVGLAVESGRLIVKPRKEPRKRPRYTLDELLAQCDPPSSPKAARTRKERAWLVDKPVGGELI